MQPRADQSLVAPNQGHVDANPNLALRHTALINASRQRKHAEHREPESWAPQERPQ